MPSVGLLALQGIVSPVVAYLRDLCGLFHVVLLVLACRLQLVPLHPIRTGEELLIDYGYRSPIDSLADYGFIL